MGFKEDTGVQSKNNEYHIVNKVENQGIYEWNLNLIDNVVFVVFALYSRTVGPTNFSLYLEIKLDFKEIRNGIRIHRI